MVHQGQRLALGLEAGDDLLRIHPRLDDLERDLAADGLGLLGHVDDAHAAFADLFEQLVGADDGTGPLGDRRQAHFRPAILPELIKQPGGLRMAFQQDLDLAPQGGIARAGLVQETRTLVGAVVLDGVQEDRLDPGGIVVHHDLTLRFLSSKLCEIGRSKVQKLVNQSRESPGETSPRRLALSQARA
jgi:hypothetical protein